MIYFLFIFIFIYVANWGYVHYAIHNLFFKKERPKDFKDPFVQEILKKKAGLTISNIKLFPPTQFYGVMPSNPPFKPVLVLSEKAYKDFNKDEMEWLVLHEAGHYVLWHGAIGILAHIFFALFGIIVLAHVHQVAFLVAVALGILGGMLFIQFAHWRERQANLFAVKRMDNPLGMKTAAQKMLKHYATIGNERTLFARFFFVWNYYVRQQQIRDAVGKMEKE